MHDGKIVHSVFYNYNPCCSGEISGGEPCANVILPRLESSDLGGLRLGLL
jgi:hypothetical protein